MAKNKKPVTRKDLLNEMEEKIQALNLLKSTLQRDRSRKEDTLEEYWKKYIELLAR